MDDLSRLIRLTARELDLDEELVSYVIRQGYFQQLRFYLTHPKDYQEVYIKNCPF
jgi:hypothetical protein